jgi:hypothetical protein
VTPKSVLLEVPKVGVVNTTPAPGLGSGFAGGRPVPVFSAPSIAVRAHEVQSIPVPLEAKSLPNKTIEAVATKPKPTSGSVQNTPVQKNTPIATIQAPAVNSVVSKAETAVTAVSGTRVPTDQPPVVPLMTSAVTVSPVSLPEVSPDVVSTRMERIRIIKSDVNDRVGNPVNLVDIDNALGREYMSALLEAMKLLSSASEAESKKAMMRLETVYSQVQTLLNTKKEEDVTISNTVVAPTLAADGLSEILPVVQPQPVVAAPVVRVSVPEKMTPVTPATISEVTPVAEFVVRSKVTDKPEKAQPLSSWGDADSITNVPVQVIENVSQRITPSETTAVARMSTQPAEPLRSTPQAVPTTDQPEVAQSVSQVTPLRAITELPTAAEVSAVEAMSSNPLYTKDVDAVLEQLLGEWSIFKKSGLFGTGPKGREHPLYVKLSPLQVPIILSGRFEGSTQEIKQSITDYMNGWRYEQGIIYEPNETLDQYLRRVIRHIIDLQKNKRRS